MRFEQWCQEQGRGALSDVMRATGLSYVTIHKASQGKPIHRYSTAKLISDATGGAVSIQELCEPQPKPGAAA